MDDEQQEALELTLGDLEAMLHSGRPATLARARPRTSGASPAAGRPHVQKAATPPN